MELFPEVSHLPAGWPCSIHLLSPPHWATQPPLPVSVAHVCHLVWFTVICLNTSRQVWGHTLVGLLPQNRTILGEASLFPLFNRRDLLPVIPATTEVLENEGI